MTENSPNASRLLEILTRQAPCRERAIPDRELARMIECPERDVIDLATELLAAKHAVIAETAPPFGRWLATRMSDLPAARTHANSLGRRGVRILRRRKLLRAAIEATRARLIEDHRQALRPGAPARDDQGQGYLFTSPARSGIMPSGRTGEAVATLPRIEVANALI